MNTMQPTNCLNCEETLNGPFCSQCGQKETHRYTVGHVLHELVHVFTHADKGIFSFVWNILRKPGTVALDLVEGRRKRYFNLFQYLLIIVGFVTFLIVQNDLIGMTVKSMNTANGMAVSEKQALVQQQSTALLQKYNNIFQLLLIPVYAFFSWLFMARKKYNYAERLVLHAASSAQTNTLAVVTTSIMLLSNNVGGVIIMTIVSLIIMVTSFAMSYRQFFKFSILKSVGYGLLVFGCSYITQALVVGMGVALYTIIQLSK
jgi:Protein of unknown function (DUF3667)